MEEKAFGFEDWGDEVEKGFELGFEEIGDVGLKIDSPILEGCGG